MTSTAETVELDYTPWIGHRGQDRATYGQALLKRLSADLSTRFGRGFSKRNLEQMRLFYVAWPPKQISQTVSAKLDAPQILQTLSAKSSDLSALAQAFPLPWSAYVSLLSVKSPQAGSFYEAEALRNGWSVRQLDRQMDDTGFTWICCSSITDSNACWLST